MKRSESWSFSCHAEERCAKRLGLIVDDAVRARISRQIESKTALRVAEQKEGRAIYEIDLMGHRTIAVCNPQNKIIITVMDAKEWYRSVENKRRRAHIRKPDSDEEE